MVEDVIINRVANSGLDTINLEDFYHPGKRMTLDIASQLFRGLILKEKDFRDWIKSNDWSVYEGANVSIICSADAIVPTWAYMLVASKLSGVANHFVFGDSESLELSLFQMALQKLNPEEFKDKRIVIKGCGSLPVPVSAYVELSRLLLPHVKTLMFGEPCSTVPVYKKPAEAVK